MMIAWIDVDRAARLYWRRMQPLELGLVRATICVRPRQDSNLRTRLRRPMLYPLSYEGGGCTKPGSEPPARHSRGKERC